MKFVKLTLALLCIFSAQVVISQNTYKRLYPEKCDSLIKANTENPNFVILDVRTQGEWLPDHLEGSINRSTGDSDFQQRLALLPKHKIYLLHCKSGGRSAGAFSKMKNLQFAEVYEMIGGINGWKSKQYPTSSELRPILMVVSQSKMKGDTGDTVQITLTNRANSKLSFQSIEITDLHEIAHDFNGSIELEGSADYTFSIYHSPGYSTGDSTQVVLKSNGGDVDIKVIVGTETSTNILSHKTTEVEVYPNPVSSKLFFRGIQTELLNEIAIYNLSGQIVLQKYNHETGSALSVSGLSEGIHLLRINRNGHILTKKLLIKH